MEFYLTRRATAASRAG